MKKSANLPIVLSGRVFLSKLLAEEIPRLGLPRELQNGDVKLLAIARNPKGRHYAGFIRAYVYILAEKRWSTLALRAAAASEATYNDEVERVSRARACIEHLRSLRGSTANWGDKTYLVKVKAVRPQDSTAVPVTTHGGGRHAVSPAAASTTTAHGAGSAPGADQTSGGSSAAEPVGTKHKVGEQLTLF